MALQESQLMAYLNETLGGDEKIELQSPLFSSGLFDSVTMLNLIMYIEETQGKRVPPQDVTLENFDSPESIIRYCGEL